MSAKKKTPAKKSAQKTVKKAATKKAPKKATTKKALKKATTKKALKKATTKKAPKKATTKKTVAKKTSAPKKAAPRPTASEKKIGPLKKAIVSRTGVVADKKSSPIVFSIDDIEELMASKKSNRATSEATGPKKALAKPKAQPAKKALVEDAPVEKRVLGAASLADILGFNPSDKKKKIELGDSEIPKKWKKYYNLLIELRTHVSDEISLHTSETLKHSSRDDSGDLSNYSSHQADAGTDTFDRDFALSLVSNEQDALNEIEEAILRIKNGSYGACEITGKQIPAARLTAVPFARYSVEGQAEHEKNQHRKHNRSVAMGIFGDATDAPKLESSDDED
jgi:RNA polymerase-binding transcription factor DksA